MLTSADSTPGTHTGRGPQPVRCVDRTHLTLRKPNNSSWSNQGFPAPLAEVQICRTRWAPVPGTVPAWFEVLCHHATALLNPTLEMLILFGNSKSDRVCPPKFVRLTFSHGMARALAESGARPPAVQFYSHVWCCTMVLYSTVTVLL